MSRDDKLRKIQYALLMAAYIGACQSVNIQVRELAQKLLDELDLPEALPSDQSLEGQSGTAATPTPKENK